MAVIKRDLLEAADSLTETVDHIRHLMDAPKDFLLQTETKVRGEVIGEDFIGMIAKFHRQEADVLLWIAQEIETQTLKAIEWGMPEPQADFYYMLHQYVYGLFNSKMRTM